MLLKNAFNSGFNCDWNFSRTIVAGTTDSEEDIVPCSQGEEEEEEGTWSSGLLMDVEDEVSSVTVTDR